MCITKLIQIATLFAVIAATNFEYSEAGANNLDSGFEGVQLGANNVDYFINITIRNSLNNNNQG